MSSDAIKDARQGRFDLFLTPTKPVPMTWFPSLKGAKTLCLASGGGQQGPLLAAAGARVTVFDNSSAQLAQDRFVAERDELKIETIEGDMADLAPFSDDTFDLIVHPVSNCFLTDIKIVWRECHRVLRPGGKLLTGFTNPLRYIFNQRRLEQGELQVSNSIPYSDAADLSVEDRQQLIFDGTNPFEFGHTLTDQIGGQFDAGFMLMGLFEDRYADSANDPISKFVDSFIATRAIKPRPIVEIRDSNRSTPSE